MKFPRTPHLPGSKATNDDIFATPEHTDTTIYVATEKMDGSNIMMDSHGFGTRNGEPSSAEWVYPARNIWFHCGHLIPEGVTLAGELLTWRKSIAYESLPGEYMIFGAVRDGECLSWSEVCDIADCVGLPIVKEFARGTFDEVVEQSKKLITPKIEGFVVRPVDAFPFTEYAKHVSKFVGAHHNPVAGNNGRNGFEITR